jgi:hypothetical protein
MDYSIRRVDQKTPQTIAPRRKRDEERAPFDFTEREERRPSAGEPPEASTSAPTLERAIAPPDDAEIGAHLDLSA